MSHSNLLFWRDMRARHTVNVYNAHELRRWATELGVAAETLEAVVMKVGVQLSAVRKELALQASSGSDRA